MSTYAQLKAEIEALQARAAEALRAEKTAAIQEIQAKIVQYGITAADLGLQLAERKQGRPPKRPDDDVTGTPSLNLVEHAPAARTGSVAVQ